MRTKFCPRCRLDLDLSSFGWRDAEHTKPQSYCRACMKGTWRAWYGEQRNRSHHLELVSARRQRRIKRHLALIRELKSRPCADCGTSYPPYVMDFDHVRGEKLGLISEIARTSGTDQLEAEIEKCEVVCANCHRERSFRRQSPRNGKPVDWADGA